MHNSVVFLAAFLLMPYSLAAHERSARRMAAGLAALLASGASAGRAALAGLGGGGPRRSRATWRCSSFRSSSAWGAAAAVRAAALEQLTVQLEREREERARAAVADERARIARELHDEIAHAMSVIAVQADAAEGALAAIRRSSSGRSWRSGRPPAKLSATCGGCSARSVEKQAQLAPEPGLSRLGSLLEQTRDSGLEVDLRIEGEPAPLPPALDLAAYRSSRRG